MNEKLQQEIAAWLETMRAGIEAAGNFAIEQAPLVIQEKIAWGRAFETIWLAVGIIAVLALLYYSRRVWSWGLKNSDESDGFSVFVSVLYSIGSIIVFTAAMEQLNLALQVWLAPRIYIIEWLANLVKDVK